MEHPYSDLPDVGPICLVPSHSVVSPHTSTSCNGTAFDTLLDGLRHLRADHTSGARELATQAVASLVRVAAATSSSTRDEDSAPSGNHQNASACDQWWEATRRAAWAISRYGRPSMGAAITVAVVSAMDQARAGLSEDPRKLSAGRDENDSNRDRIIETSICQMRDYLQQRSRGAETAAVGAKFRQLVLQNLQHRIDESGRLVVKILTLSSSSTVRQALTTLLGIDDKHGPNITVDLRIMESRPLCEGVSLAKALAMYASTYGLDDRLHVEIAPDSGAAMLSRGVDLVLLGADRISAAGDVSNKTGSLPAVLCAKVVSTGVSVVTVAELEKIAKPGGMEEHGEEDNDVGEVASAWREKFEDSSGGVGGADAWAGMVAVRNVYFEWVPAAHIDYYICEDGLLSADNIRERSEKTFEAETRLFGDLDDSARASRQR